MDAWLFSTTKEIEEATEGFTPAHYRSAPAGKWNSEQILDHLLKTYTTTTKVLRRRLDEQVPEPVRSRTMKERAMQFVVCTMGVMPEGRKAPSFTIPQEQVEPDVRTRVLSALETMDRVLAEAERRWGRKTLIADHPILGPMNVEQWRRLHHTHALHHMKQVRERAKGAVAKSA